jgi:23S rRNA (uracil1939-C5)-methyltransferase
LIRLFCYEEKLKKGDLIELEITKYAFEGKGIGKIQNEHNTQFNTNEKKSFVIFVNGAYPGDVVIVKITKVKSSYAEAKIEKFSSQSDERIKAKCKHFGVCGGCKQQDLNYQSQIKYKQEQVNDIFNRIGRFENYEQLDIIPSDISFFYRNKLEFSFADKKWLSIEDLNTKETENTFALGFHVPKIFNKVVDIEECCLQSEESNKILNFTREFFRSRNTSIYSTHTHSGFLRNLVVKQSKSTKDLMVNLVTSAEDYDLIEEYSSSIIKKVPQITTLVNNINLKKAATAIGDYEKIYYGSGFIYDKIGDYRFRISANSFFQTNTFQAAKLYQTALNFANLNNNEIVYDLYSGAGTISIFMYKYCKEVYAFESVASAIKDAEENNRINDINNVKYFTSDLNKSFLQLVKDRPLPPPQVVVLDPPRSGMNHVTIKDVIELNPKKIVYLSCNPTTQVRDLKLFEMGGYKLIKIRPVDMFPHTYHIENVALMIRD